MPGPPRSSMPGSWAELDSDLITIASDSSSRTAIAGGSTSSSCSSLERESQEWRAVSPGLCTHSEVLLVEAGNWTEEYIICAAPPAIGRWRFRVAPRVDAELIVEQAPEQGPVHQPPPPLPLRLRIPAPAPQAQGPLPRRIISPRLPSARVLFPIAATAMDSNSAPSIERTVIPRHDAPEWDFGDIPTGERDAVEDHARDSERKYGDRTLAPSVTSPAPVSSVQEQHADRARSASVAETQISGVPAGSAVDGQTATESVVGSSDLDQRSTSLGTVTGAGDDDDGEASSGSPPPFTASIVPQLPLAVVSALNVFDASGAWTPVPGDTTASSMTESESEAPDPVGPSEEGRRRSSSSSETGHVFYGKLPLSLDRPPPVPACEDIEARGTPDDDEEDEVDDEGVGEETEGEEDEMDRDEDGIHEDSDRDQDNNRKPDDSGVHPGGSDSDDAHDNDKSSSGLGDSSQAAKEGNAENPATVPQPSSHDAHFCDDPVVAHTTDQDSEGAMSENSEPEPPTEDPSRSRFAPYIHTPTSWTYGLDSGGDEADDDDDADIPEFQLDRETIGILSTLDAHAAADPASTLLLPDPISRLLQGGERADSPGDEDDDDDDDEQDTPTVTGSAMRSPTETPELPALSFSRSSLVDDVLASPELQLQRVEALADPKPGRPRAVSNAESLLHPMFRMDMEGDGDGDVTTTTSSSGRGQGHRHSASVDHPRSSFPGSMDSGADIVPHLVRSGGWSWFWN